MNTFHLDASPLTPAVRLVPAEQRLELSGECYPENPLPFFAELFAALQRHLETRPPRFEASFRLGYVNSASTKALRKLLVTLDHAAQAGCHVEVTWAFEASDETIADLGKDLTEDLGFLTVLERPFELRAA